MSKCILLVRVSTERQSFDEQERQLYDMALRDGFTDNNIISIAMVESAIKLSEEERQGLNEMKRYIEQGDIACVYAWEVSRISRRKDVLYSILHYLIERKINVKIKDPSITYLNEDGTINDLAELSFSLFASLAESEMRNKKARFKRSAIRNARKGKHSGGSILYGYSVGADGYYVINEEEAKIIRLVFSLYTSSNVGAKLLRNELRDRGLNLTSEKILEILATEAYTGKPYITRKRKGVYNYVGGYERVYPKIITEETYQRAKAKRQSKHYIKTESCFLAKGLIHCPLCGWSYVGIRGKNARMYKCGQYNLADKHGRHCDNHVTVQMELTDSIIWYASSFLYTLYLSDLRTKDASLLENKVKELKIKVLNIKNYILTLPRKTEKISISWINGRISETTYNKMIAEINNDKAERERDVEGLEQEIEELNKLIAKINSVDEYSIFSNTEFNVSSITDRKRMLGIVNQFVHSVDVANTEFEGKKAKAYRITFKDSTVQEFVTTGRITNAKIYELVNDKYYEITDKVKLLKPI
ncbi:MAG: recombinase family protein [Muribaculaceae bacterium]|nr:recombinase family protein [Muribaculaceae bacterium]